MIAIDINLEKDFLRLVDIGHDENFEELAVLSDFQDHHSVCRLVDERRDAVIFFASRLSDRDRNAFIKSIAMLEHRVGGLGSVTILTRLLPLDSNPDRRLLDWILRNTKSYRWYTYGALSIEQFERTLAGKAADTAKRATEEKKRQLEGKKRIAEKATHNLSNAVRRGDIKAIRALVSKGANTMALSHDGRSMTEVASSLGHIAIAAELSKLAKHQDNTDD